ncbi:MAG: cadherin repeat domain-containing protein, partial [Rhizobiaceae bacterium]|nr:cadherin repeat domain-containing protein [Rhizobiaceae bacterium]
MSELEQGTGKAVAAKKNKVDVDLLNQGSETPIERIDIVLPGVEEQDTPATNADEQPLKSDVASSAPALADTTPQDVQGADLSSNSNFDKSGVVTQNSSSNAGQDNTFEIQNTPSLDGVNLNSVQSGAGAPLAPELNALDEGSNTSNANQQSSTSSGGGSTTPGGSDEVNVAPTDIVYDNSSVDENASGGTVIATLSTVDANDSDTHTYAIVSDPSGYFEIVGDEIRVREGADLDFETAPLHEITIQATDSTGNSFTETMTIDLNDVNETSITAISDTDASGNTVTEGASVGTAVGITALASDADATDTISYSLSSNPGGFFAIDANTGEVTVAGSLDYETDTSHTIEVTATSSDGTTSTQTFTIAVGDEMDQTPTDIIFTDHIEDFEGGASGWSNNTTTDGGNNFSEFLGRFGHQTGLNGTEKTFSTPEGTDKTVIELD